MNFFLATAVILVAAGVVHAGSDYPKLKEYFIECAGSTQAKETYESVIEQRIVPTSNEGMCLMECLMEKKGFLDKEGKYNSEGAKNYLRKKYEDSDEKYNKAVQIINECSKIAKAKFE